MVGLIYLPTSLFQTNRIFSHKVETDTLQTNHRLEFNRIFLSFVIPNLFRVDFLYAHKPHCYTRFYPLQPLKHTFSLASASYVSARSYWDLFPVACNFPYPHYTFACSLRFINLLSFFHRLWPQPLTASTVISVL